jgi:glycerol-3-phosphate dehydrogenase (NAD(P)+)
VSRPLVVVGGGSWGTALAIHASRVGREVRLWVHDPVLLETMRAERENRTYLPGHPLPGHVVLEGDLARSVAGASVVLLAVPSHHLRGVARSLMPHLDPDADVLIGTKGIEADSLRRMSEVVHEESGIPIRRLAVLSGPSFAAEVAAGHPTAIVVASSDPGAGERMQRALSHSNLRLYRNPDLIGVEIGGALKNVVAIAAGILEGLGHGANTSAALLTRGLHEMTRLAVALGGQRETMAGLAGMGDLVLTCGGRLSRNRQVGVALGRGEPLAEILAPMRMVAEGVRTSAAAVLLAQRAGVEMPIAERVAAVLFRGLAPREAIANLLARELKDETPL